MLHSATCHEAEVHSLALHGREFLVSASADSTIRLWDALRLLPLYALRCKGQPDPIAHAGPVYAVTVVPALPSRAVWQLDGNGVLLCVPDRQGESERGIGTLH